MAEELAMRLGYPCVSREDIIRDAVRQFNVSEEKLTSTLAGKSGSRIGALGGEAAHLNYLRVALLEKVLDGKIIYHGHAVQYLLGKMKGALRVRINADMTYRINSAMRQHRLSREQTTTMINELDKQSARWARVMYGVDWNDPFLFDVVFNLECLSIQSVVDILVQMTMLDEFTPDESSRKTLENLRLESMVWAVLAKGRRTHAASVDVSADNGRVTIRGSVGSKQVVNEIIAVAQNVPGVRSVTSHIGIGSNWLW